MSRRDKAIGIAAGVLLGIGVVAAFVFAGGGEEIDAPAIEDGAPEQAGGEQRRDDSGERDRSAENGGPKQPREEGEGGGRYTGGRERKPPVPDIFVRNGEPQGGVETFEFRSGEEVRFRVISDAPAEIHVHGYDVYKDVTPGEPAAVSFPAEFEGAFEVELHLHDTGAEAPIAELRVTPG